MERNKIIFKTSIIGIIVNIFLVIFKICVGIFSKSISIILDGVNNLTDVLSSVVTIVGTKLAGKAPDKEHPYGHGRIEYFSSVIVSVIILLAGIMAFKESIDKIINPLDTDYSLISLLIISVAVVTKIILGTYVKNKGIKVNSQSLVASGKDALMDSVLSFSTLLGALIKYIWNIGLEGYIGILISFVIVKTAIEVMKQSVNSILGVRVDSELAHKLKKRLVEFDEVEGAYDLNIHNYGPFNLVASVHVQVRNDMTAEEIHILTRKISYKIYKEFGISLTIGIYASNDKGEYGQIKNDLLKITNDYNEILQFHGFFVDKKNSNIYFDLIIGFECENPKQIRDEVIERIKKLYPEYNYYVIIDLDITD